MTVNLTWVSPAAAGTLDLATGAVITETWVDAVASDLLVLGGTNGLTHTGAYTITSGGLTVTAGGVTVTAGNVGIGGAPVGSLGLFVAGALTASGAQASGIQINNGLTLTAAANSDTLAGIRIFQPTFAPAGRTGVVAAGIMIDTVIGANANNYGIYIAAPSGASGSNIGLYNAGATKLTPGAFAASDKYLVVDASGNVHVSALGPAS